MSVREYIGARYVPIFADPIAWDSATAYEPLTIVTYNGNSYTSRQFVPSGLQGTPDTLTQYWALTGNYNAQVEAYREEVLAFDQRITSNSEAIADEATAREEADTNLQGVIQNETTAREEADTRLANRITEIENSLSSRLLIVGDSWAAFNEGFDNWANLITANANYTYSQFAVGGTGWHHRGGSNVVRQGNVEEQIEYAYNNMTEAERNEVCAILVIAGVNDLNTTTNYSVSNAYTDIKAGMQAAKNKAIARFGKVPMYALFNVPFVEYKRSDNFASRMFALESKLVNSACKDTQIIPVCNANWGLYCDTGLYRSDNLHPSQYGARVIAQAFLQTMLGTQFNAHFAHQANNFTMGSFSTKLDFAFENGKLTLAISEITGNAASVADIPVPASGWGVLANILRLSNNTSNFANFFNRKV